MWIPSVELRGSMLYSDDVEEHREMIPEEVWDRVSKMDIMGIEACERDFMYGIEGWIIQSGLIGIRPDASEEVKTEWREYWTIKKNNPLREMCVP